MSEEAEAVAAVDPKAQPCLFLLQPDEDAGVFGDFFFSSLRLPKPPADVCVCVCVTASGGDKRSELVTTAPRVAVCRG